MVRVVFFAKRLLFRISPKLSAVLIAVSLRPRGEGALLLETVAFGRVKRMAVVEVCKRAFEFLVC